MFPEGTRGTGELDRCMTASPGWPFAPAPRWCRSRVWAPPSRCPKARSSPSAHRSLSSSASRSRSPCRQPSLADGTEGGQRGDPAADGRASCRCPREAWLTTRAQDSGADVTDAAAPAAAPVVAVVGRPNVGKSTLVNRILGRRAAVVEDVPGVTRDRVAYDATWNGRRFTVVDTGGWEPSARGLAAAVAEQAQIAVELADAVLFVSTRRSGPPTRTRPSPACCSVPAGPSCWRPTRLTTRAWNPMQPACGRWGWVSRIRCQRCTGAAAAICSMPSSRRFPSRRRRCSRGEDGGPRRVALARTSERRQVLAAEQARR